MIGLGVFVEVFWKSSIVLGAALCASALLRKKSADLRRLVLSTSVAAMFVAALAAPALPSWTAAAPAWFRLPASPAPAALERPADPGMPGNRPELPTAQRGSAATSLPARRPLTGSVPAIPLIWFGGTAILLIRFIAGLYKLRRLRTASHALSDDAVAEHRVSLLQNDTVDAPVTWGIVRPVILVPARFHELPTECRNQVLCHELAHIQGHDFLLRVLVEIARAAIWFQPLIWITRRQLREEQELACDDRVLAAGGRSSAYAKLLLDWDGGLTGRNSIIAIGMAQRNCLKRRLYALLDLDIRRDRASGELIAVTWLLGLATALPLAAFSFAQGPAPLPQTPSAPPQVAVSQATPEAVAEAPAAAPATVAAEAAAPVQAAAVPSPTPDSQVVFEVATVKHGRPGDYSAGGSGGPGTHDPTTYSVENYPLSSLLEIAYGIASYQLSGPSWLIEERFTVTAKLPAGTTKEQLALMMRNLLMERFQLAAHFETREVAGYQLVVARGGPKLSASPGDPAQTDPAKPDAEFKWAVDKEGYPELPPGRKYAMAMGYGRARWRFADESMQEFTATLGDWMHNPIINGTGLPGKYDFVMSWYTEAQPNAAADSGPSIFAAVQEQLGLKLESQKIPVKTVVIDHIERMPSEN